MKKTMPRLFFICLLMFSILFSASVQNAEASIGSQEPEAQKMLLPAPTIIKEDLAKLVTQNIITKEQAEIILPQLSEPSANAKQPIDSTELKDCLGNMLSAGIITQAQAVTVIEAICREMPEGVPEIPETTAVFTVKGKEIAKAQQKYIGSRQNESGVVAAKKGILTLTKSIIQTTGSASQEYFGIFYGLNAGILAKAGGTIHLSDSTISTAGDGSSAIFSTGNSSLITLANVKIYTSGVSSFGLGATAKGLIQADSIDISTAGDNSPAAMADRVNGTILVRGGVLKTAGKYSPGIYSAGNMIINDAIVNAAAAEAAQLEGRNSLTLNNTTLTGNKGVLLFQDYTGSLEAGVGSFTMNGGTLTAESGPSFYVTNIEGKIELTDAAIAANSKRLLEVAAGKWGTKKANGGKLDFTAIRENLAGSIFCDNISTLTINLKDHTTLTGTINDVRTAGSVNLILDNTSTWKVTGNSYLSSLTNADTTLCNIDDNGFSVYYDASLPANKWLQGKTYTLKDGGKLIPSEIL